MTHFDDFVQGYSEAMLWANTYAQETEESEPTEVEPAWWQDPGRLWALRAFDGAGQQTILEDCAGFVASNLRDLVMYARELGYAQAGHDFALTRNGHGAGFWDRGLGDLGERLSDASRPYGSLTGFVYGDDTTVTLV